ncbi:MAG: superoxide dismutase [Planctomycetaceae bacterium]|nr:superoxide dismutase [Planctomycetaceae bacterium]
MISTRITWIFVAIFAATGMVGCATTAHEHHAVAVMRPTAGNQAHGIVTFEQIGDGVRIIANIDGLTPNAQHAFHIHQFDDVRDPAGKSAGGHYNPEAMPHGRPQDAHRHAGDLGNLQADANGHATYDRVDNRFSISKAMNPILGRGVIVHAGEDQFTQPTGAAGARIAAGVIGIAKP